MTQPGDRVGSVYVDVEPDTTGFEQRLERDTLPAAQRLGKEIASRIAAPIAARISEEISDGLRAAATRAEPAARRAGEKIGDRIGSAIRASIEKALKDESTARVDADTKQADKKLAALEKRLAALSGKTLKVDVDVESGKVSTLAAEMAALHPLAKVAVDVDVSAALAEVASLEGALSGIQQISSQFPALDMDVTPALAKITQLQGEITAAEQATSFNLDIDTTGATAQLAAFAATVAGLSPSLTIQVSMPDADEVGRRIGREAGQEFERAFRNAVGSGPPVSPPGPPGSGPPAAAAAGRRDGGAYGRAFRSAIDQSLSNLQTPRPVLNRRLSNDELEVNEVFRRLTSLRDVEIGVNFDRHQAEAELRILEGILFSLQQRAERGSTLEFNTQAAQEGLRRFREQLQDLGQDPAQAAAQGRQAGSAYGRTYAAGVEAALNNFPEIEIDGNTSEIDRDIQLVRQRLQFLSTARIGIDIDEEEATREIDRLRQELIRLGQMSPSVQVQADTQAAALQLANLQRQLAQLAQQNPDVNVDVDTGAATASLGRLTAASVVAQASVYGIGVAGLSLVTILIPAAAAAAAAIGAIGVAAFGAVAALGVAAVALSGVVGAVQAVSAAQEETGQGAAQAAQRYGQLRSAADGVRNAERSLADAQKDARRAQEDLAEARKAAREEYEDLELSIRGNALAQARAQDDLAEAEAEYNRVKDDPNATAEQRREANLAYEEAKLRVDELAVRARRLAEAEEEANRKGIEGSDQVVAAKDRIAQANQRVIQATEALAAAHRQQAQAAQAAGGTTSAAAKKAQDALAKLTPEGRAFVQFILGIKDSLGELRRAAERSFLPGLQRGIAAMLPALPAITLMIERFGGVLGALAEDAGKAFASPFMLEFFEFLGTTGATVFDLFARAAGNVLKAVIAIVMAFGPFAEQFGRGLLTLTERFAAWATGLSESSAFTAFTDYVTDQGPKLITIFGDLALVLLKLAIALVPLATLAVEGLLRLFEWLAELSPGQLLAIGAAIGGIAAAILIFAGGPVTAIVAGLTLVVAGLVYAYQRFEAFRNIVNTVAGAWIAFAKVMFEFWRMVFQNVIVPAAKAWWEFAQVMGRAYMWLWENAIRPTGQAIATAATWLWRNVLEPAWRGIQVAISAAWVVIEPIYRAIVWWLTNVLGPGYLWLYNEVIKPVFQAAVVLISVAWAAIQVIFGLIVGYLKIVGAAFRFLYDTGVKPAFDLIATVISNTWTTRVKPVLDLVGNFITQQVAPKFRAGVDLLIFWWEALRDGLKRPIKFVIETVLNNGLLAGYRWIAEKFDLPNKDLRIPMPAGFAAGGYITGPGTGTSDSIMARLSNGEYVIPAHIVRSLGVDFFDWLIGKRQANARNVKPGDGSEGLAFAEGGLVGWLKGAWNTLTDPVGKLKEKAFGILNDIPGGKVAKETIAGFTKKVIIEGFLGKVSSMITNLFTSDGYHGPITSDVAGVRDFIARQAGKPYVWAAAGPHGYDCSGIVSAAWNLMHGRNPYSHTFSTHTQARFFPKVGVVGPLTAGWSHPGERGGGRVGHTAGNIAGLPFESGGSKGVVVGSRAVPFTSFARFGTFDTGGWLMPGLTYAYNGTGKPERILTNDQWDAMGRGSGGGTTYVVQPQRADFTIQDLDALVRRRDALTRLGRPA